MKKQTREDPKIMAAAERQMQSWSLAQEIAERVLQSEHDQESAGPLGRFITISREAGTGGERVAELVGEALEWEVLDKKLLDRVADQFQLPRQMLDLVDETETNWAYDMFGPWLDPKVIPHEKYFTLLSRVLLAAAKRGSVVLVGRGSQFLLPRDQGLAVRIVAPEKYRVKKLAEDRQLESAEAYRLMVELDRGRHAFVRHFFHHDISDPHFYDLVINVGRLGLDKAARQIVAAHRDH